MKEIIENKTEKSIIKKKHFFSKNTRQYIEGIIYVLSIIVVIFLNCTGPLYVKMIPLLSILGIIGIKLFKRPIITTVFGIITSMCITKISGINDINIILLISIADGIQIALGEVIGYYGTEAFRYFMMKRASKSNKAIRYYAITIIALFLAAIAHNYINGDYFTYSKAKKNLYNYLEINYNDYNKFEVISSNYDFINKRCYTFKLKNNSRDVTSNFFIYSSNINKVVDEYRDVVLDKKNNELMSDIINYINDKNYKVDFDIGIKYLADQSIRLEVYKDVSNFDDNTKEIFVNNVVEFIKLLKEFKKYNKIEELSISVNSIENEKLSVNSILNFNDLITKVNNNQMSMQDYIKESFKVEFFDLDV